MRFSSNFLQEIRERIPISDVVGRRVQFDPKKSNPGRGDYWACCPFHGEKTPSFHCENDKSRYHCFGCGESGDHFTFLMKLDGMSFPEAVEMLANEAGLALPAVDPKAAEREKARASLQDVMALAAQFFRDQLQAQAGAAARAYLRDRGLSAQVQETFGLGYAPSSRSALKEFLGSKGIEKDQIEACGLVVHGPDIPVSYDRFRDRVMFPILDARSHVIAFGGRALSADVPAKYLNSPETELFSKSNVLYNYARARRATERDGNLIVVEGYMDVIALHSAGFENAVPPLGTALTERQIELAWRVGGEPILCFDGDEAGLRAAYRSVDTALAGLQAGKSLRFALLPSGEDPDDLLKRGGRDAFTDVLKSARPLADMLWNRETAGRVFDTPERRAALEATLRQILGQVKNEDVRRHYQQEMRERLSQFFGTGPKKFQGNRRNDQQAYGRSAAPGQQRLAVSDSLMNSALVKPRTTLPPLRPTALIVTVLHHPLIGLKEFDTLASLDLDHPALARIQHALLDFFAEQMGGDDEAPSPEELKQTCDARGLEAEYRLLVRHVRNNRVWQADSDASLQDAMEGWNQALALHQRAVELRLELKAAEEAFNRDGDEDSWDRLVGIKDELEREKGIEALIEGFGLASDRPSRSM
jgi:DNA primase